MMRESIDMKSSKSVRIDQEAYDLLRAKKDEFQKEKRKKITYSQLIKYLIGREIPFSEAHEVSSPLSEILVRIPQLEEVPIKCEMQIPLRLPEAGILLRDDVETRVRIYAEEREIPFSEAVNNLLLYALELREEVLVVLTTDLKKEFEELYSLLDGREREKLKKDLKKIVTLYTKKLLKSYSKKVKSRKCLHSVKR